MNKVRLYLIVAIMLVGLIPDPERLFGIGEVFDRCRSYSSVFIYLKRWGKNDDCYWGPWMGTVLVSVPGLSGAEQILPEFTTFIAPLESGGWKIWGSIDPPRFGRDANLVKDLHFDLLPEQSYCWLNAYTPFSDCWD